jgi:hypothetical protein
LGGGLEVIGAIGGVINKTEHIELDHNRAVRREEAGSVGLCRVAVKEHAAYEEPVDRGIPTALACAIDWVEEGMLDVSIGESKFSAEVIAGFFEGAALDNAYLLPIKAIFLAG